MVEGKWIADLEPGMPLHKAAALVLRARLEVVRHYLPLVQHEADRDDENVHQLRVGTRRADAALRIFRCCFPNRAYRAARERLRAIRRAAGAARDWDVFTQALKLRLSDADADELPGLDFLIGYSSAQRMIAQQQIELIEADEEESFSDFARSFVDKVQSPEEELTLQTHGRHRLGKLLILLDEAASDDLKDYEHLHRVRILGKRLRYAMEVFVDCFDGDFKHCYYPLIEEMQEILGCANDSYVAVQRLTGLRDSLRTDSVIWPRLRPGIAGLLRFHQRRLPQERRRFAKCWTQWREAAMEKALRVGERPA